MLFIKLIKLVHQISNNLTCSKFKYHQAILMLCNKNKRIRGASRKQGWTFIYFHCFHRVTFRKNPLDNIANTDLDRIYEFHVILASVSGYQYSLTKSAPAVLFSWEKSTSPVLIFRDLEGRRMEIAATSSVLTQLSFVRKNFEKFALSKSVSQSKTVFIVYSEPIESGHVKINFS